MQVRVVAFFCMQLHIDNGAIKLAFQTDIYFPMRTKDKQTYNIKYSVQKYFLQFSFLLIFIRSLGLKRDSFT